MEKGNIVFAQGHYFRVKEVDGGKTNLELLTIEEVNEYENELRRKKYLEEHPEVCFRVNYKDGQLSRKFFRKSKTLKYAKRKQNVNFIAEYRNDEFVRKLNLTV